MKKITGILLLSFVVCLTLQAQVFRTIAKSRSEIKRISYRSSKTNGNNLLKPKLKLTDVSIFDNNANHIFDRNEQIQIELQVLNSGEATARDVYLKLTLLSSEIKGISFSDELYLGNIYPGSVRKISLPVKSNNELTTGVAQFHIQLDERFGYNPESVEVKIGTHEYINPDFVIRKAEFLTDYGGTPEYNYPIYLNLDIKNTGIKPASDIEMKLHFKNDNCVILSEDKFLLNQPESNKNIYKEIVFTVKRGYQYDIVPIEITFSDKFGIYQQVMNIYLDLNQSLAGKMEKPAFELPTHTEKFISDVDINIPNDTLRYTTRYALIIGNEDYANHQPMLARESNVVFAKNDAMAFKKYANYTLGVPESNIFLLIDATYAEMLREIERVSKIMDKTPGGELLFYYAGHGYPSENSKEPYLIPVDVSATELNSAIKVADVYKRFGQTQAVRITAFIDACFTGGGRESGLIAARGFRMKPTYETLQGPLVVFNSSSGVQTSLPYHDKKHGMFTYHLLKKLQETGANISYSELADYLINQVSLESLKVNSQEQDPQVNISPQVAETWKQWHFKQP